MEEGSTQLDDLGVEAGTRSSCDEGQGGYSPGITEGSRQSLQDAADLWKGAAAYI